MPRFVCIRSYFDSISESICFSYGCAWFPSLTGFGVLNLDAETITSLSLSKQLLTRLAYRKHIKGETAVISGM